ncbi:Myb-like DNA-binding domain containing protein [Tritrichomonas foetus]|uniref:Myb-like DNA-binding domain containing protein n=1 Tax=Tritrichomonas foetus TaxID=1144522 RepID=A0A1J4KGS1_9EUKA|nr:Myb-like DNA-binding domain containing protein [Tritrichomonas foetus]|eukprot:OHT08854.1 Myb-like DNA-binding domain containing protein [Tritrichomonas foetus]
MTDELPLVLIANSFLDNVIDIKSLKLSDEQICGAKEALKKYIKNPSNENFNETLEVLISVIKDASPAYKIKEILDIAFDPDSQPLPPNSVENAKKCRNWKPCEDVRLLAGIHKFGVGDWKNISRFVGANFSRSQCSQRWCRALNPKIEKEVWTAEEQKQLLSLVERFGEHNWSVVSKNLGKRTDAQCRYRYMQIKKMITLNSQKMIPMNSFIQSIQHCKSKKSQISAKFANRVSQKRKKAELSQIKQPILPILISTQNYSQQQPSQSEINDHNKENFINNQQNQFHLQQQTYIHNMQQQNSQIVENQNEYLTENDCGLDLILPPLSELIEKCQRDQAEKAEIEYEVEISEYDEEIEKEFDRDQNDHSDIHNQSQKTEINHNVNGIGLDVILQVNKS